VRSLRVVIRPGTAPRRSGRARRMRVGVAPSPPNSSSLSAVTLNLLVVVPGTGCRECATVYIHTQTTHRLYPDSRRIEIKRERFERKKRGDPEWRRHAEKVVLRRPPRAARSRTACDVQGPASDEKLAGPCVVPPVY
jgi:hypothetical protein